MDARPARRPRRRLVATSGLLLAGAVLAATGVLAGPTGSSAAPSPAPTGSSKATSKATSKTKGGASQDLPNHDTGKKQDGYATWSLVPVDAAGELDGRSKYSYTTAPGGTLTDYMGISNFSTRALHLEIYPNDAINTSTGEFAIKQADEDATDAGSWITTKRTKVVVPARTRVSMPFTLEVPENAEPGDHVAGIVATATQKGTGNDQQQVAVNFRTGSRVYVRVTGVLTPRLVVENVHGHYTNNWNPIGRGKVDVDYTVRNAGNVRLSAHQKVSVATLWGSRVYADDVTDVPELLPGQSAQLHATVEGALPAVLLKASVDLVPVAPAGVSAPTLPNATGSVHVWAVPWALLAVILGAFLVWRLDRRRTRRLRGDGPTRPRGRRRLGDPLPTAPTDVVPPTNEEVPVA